jgi:SagB-type dehydrogenase family enzyme
MYGFSESKGFHYLQETKFNRDDLMRMDRPNIQPAPVFKEYPDSPKVELPKPDLSGKDLQAALQNRRSRRRYARQAMSREELSCLLWAAQGLTARMAGHVLRTSPSAGALYPIETYLVIHRVESIQAGLYHFDPLHFQLDALEEGDFGPLLAKACLDQRFMAQAGVSFCWSAVLRRNFSKYGHRGLRYVFMDVGHICQNLLLAAEALGLSACPVAAFFDEEINQIFQLDGREESAVYCTSVGRSG